MELQTVKVFKSGGSQAVRLPKEFRLPGDTLFIARDGDKIILSAKPLSWDSYFSKPPAVPENFMEDVEDKAAEPRELF